MTVLATATPLTDPTPITTSTDSAPVTVPVPAAASRSSDLKRPFEQACLVARVLDDFRGQDTIVLDLTNVTPIVDFFVITTGTSNRQMRAMAEEARHALKDLGSRSRGTEGAESSAWILQDYGDIVVHIFSAEARQMYDLEHLWADAPQVDWKSLMPSKKG